MAKLAGVSSSTVSRALNDHPAIGEDTKAKIRKISQELGYTPSQLSRSYYQNKSFRLGLVIPFLQKGEEVETLPKEYFSKVLLGATHRGMQNDYSINLIPDQNLKSEDLIELVKSKSVDGLIIVGAKNNDKRFKNLQTQNIPFIFVHHYDPRHPYLYVDIDPKAGMEEAILLLKNQGIKNCSFLGAGDIFINSTDRQEVFEKLCKKHSITIHSVHQGDYSRNSGTITAEVLLNKGLPDALISANDRMAYGALEAFKSAGIHIPEQIKIIGFDNQEISQLSHPQLTTIENPFYKIGQIAANLLIGKLNGENVKSQKLQSKLIRRGSA